MMSSTGETLSFWKLFYFLDLIHVIFFIFLCLFLYFDTRIIEAYTDTAWGGGFNDVIDRWILSLYLYITHISIFSCVHIMLSIKVCPFSHMNINLHQSMHNVHTLSPKSVHTLKLSKLLQIISCLFLQYRHLVYSVVHMTHCVADTSWSRRLDTFTVSTAPRTPELPSPLPHSRASKTPFSGV